MIDCPVDSFIPLPTKPGAPATQMTYLDVKARAKAALAAATMLDHEGYADDPSDLEFVQAITQSALRRTAQGKEVASSEIDYAVSTPTGAMYVDSILTAYDMEVVKDSKRLRNYVTNKLVVETENMDARIRLRALELLGKISDVGLFTERTEITINNRSTVDLENSLRDKLHKLMGKDKAEDAKVIEQPAELITEVRPSDMLANL